VTGSNAATLKSCGISGFIHFYFHAPLLTCIAPSANLSSEIPLFNPDFILIAIAFLLVIIIAYLIIRVLVSVDEERAGNDLERWKLKCTNEIQKDSISRSRSTLKGRISGQMTPLLPEFPFASADARFVRNPIDFLVFDGYTQVKDNKGVAISVVLVEKLNRSHN